MHKLCILRPFWQFWEISGLFGGLFDGFWVYLRAFWGIPDLIGDIFMNLGIFSDFWLLNWGHFQALGAYWRRFRGISVLFGVIWLFSGLSGVTLRVFEEVSGLIESILRVYLGWFWGNLGLFGGLFNAFRAYLGAFWGILDLIGDIYRDFGPILVMWLFSGLSGMILRLFEGVSGLIEGILRYFRRIQGSFWGISKLFWAIYTITQRMLLWSNTIAME